MSFRTIRLLGLGFLLALGARPLGASPLAGKISGLVVDSRGTPLMGATVLVYSEHWLGSASRELLTNDHGRFITANLPSGMYSIKVTLAGFLPAIERHIEVSERQTTLLEVMLGTAFSSLEGLRRQPDQVVTPDEWSWVLRSASAVRPILRLQDGEVVAGGELSAAESANRPARGMLELTAGADHPGSISNLADSPSTAFGYDLGLGAKGHLLVAGQFSYEGASPAGGFTAEWLPSGANVVGPVTVLTVRESRLGPEGPTFRGLRMAHESQSAVGDRIHLRYGAEYLLAGFNGATSALRPHAEMALRLTSNWQAGVLIATHPWDDSDNNSALLQSSLNTLDAFPTLLLRNGRPVLANDLHEEIAAERVLGKKAGLSAAVFHDRSTHTAVFGRGGLTGSDVIQDFFSDVFAYDAGDASSWGGRVTYKQKFSDTLDATFVYVYAGALSPNEDPSQAALRDQLALRYRQSLAARLSTSVPRLSTKVTAGYKWIDGQVVSRLDAYGESIYRLDPYLSLFVRQPLPNRFPWRMEALADFGNLLAQGYVPLSTRDGRVILVPSYRYIRGGLRFKF